MAICPNCGNNLDPRNLGIGVSYVCNACEGAAIGINALKNRNALTSLVNGVWVKARAKAPYGNKLCPFCRRQMVEVKEVINNEALELDVCKKCMMVWFDKGEQEKFPKKIENEDLSFKKIDDLSPEQRAALADFELEEKIQQEGATEVDNILPESLIKKFLTILGFPTISTKNGYSEFPIALALVVFTAIFVYIFDVINGHILLKSWGFEPALWQRNYGLNIVSSFFVHTNFLHILINLYFFILFGVKIENDLGIIRFLFLLLLSHLFGIFVHLVLNVNSHTPVVGASAGISGIMAYYAITFPKDKIHLFIFDYFYYFGHTWLRLSIQLFFALFIILQIIGTVAQFTMGTSISYVAHLGGIFGGIIVALWGRESRKEKSAEGETT